MITGGGVGGGNNMVLQISSIGIYFTKEYAIIGLKA